MLRAGLLCCAVVLGSCAEPSRLDPAPAPSSGSAAGSAADPWAAPASGKRAGFDPTDLKSTVARIAGALSRPGPYEAPDHSAKFDDAKPHWGVLALSGEIVERSALSWSGSRGTELRVLIDRLRELAGDDKLTGVLVRAGDLAISQPDAIELRAAIADLRKAGKTV